jgi:CheY-like chemotaxis protein
VTEHSENQHEQDLQKRCRKLIHDLRTPLFCIEINSKSLQLHMPQLLNAYAKVTDGDIPAEHLEVLADAGDDIKQQLVTVNQKLDTMVELLRNAESRASRRDLRNIQSDVKLKFSLDANIRVLLAEDEAIHRDIASKVLSNIDCQFDVVTHGLTAVEAAENQQFDLILMDLQMPEMSGEAATRAIRQLSPRHQQIPIIGLSNIEPPDTQAFFAMGFNTFLLKPLKLAALTNMLRQLDALCKP